MQFPANPLADANIFSLDDLQVKHVPVGCKNPYVRYATRDPRPLNGPAAPPLLGPFSEICRFPTMGFRRVTAQIRVAIPPDQIAKQNSQLQYYFVAYKDTAAAKPVFGGMVSPFYDQGDEETEVDAKELGLRCRVIASAGGGIVLLSFSVLVEP